MADYIDREEALNWKVTNAIHEDMLVYVPMAEINKHLRTIPAADVRPVVRAKWVNPEDPVCWQCSRCKKYANQEYGLDRPLFWEICPHCGAVMEEGDVEIEDESTEETKPIIHGRWVAMYTETDLPSNPFLVCWECSNCAYVRASGWEGTRAGSKPECKFCENCGAQMDGGETE